MEKRQEEVERLGSRVRLQIEVAVFGSHESLDATLPTLLGGAEQLDPY